jgi:hypothetical protein
MDGMSPGPEERLLAHLQDGLRGTFLDGRLILGGSSGLFGFDTETPAFTEDLDFLIREDLVASRGAEIVDLLSRLGYERMPETPTFSRVGWPSFDLVGYPAQDLTDHLSPPGPLQVMVFGDLGTILSDPASVERGRKGAAVLTPAGFCAVKLLTLRMEKGAKDKLQALLVIAERHEEREFRGNLSRILARFDDDRRTDALADAQSAFLSLQRDPEFKDRGAEGYRPFLHAVETGYRALVEILAESDS